MNRQIKFRAWNAELEKMNKVVMLWPGDIEHGVQVILPNGDLMLTTTASSQGIEVMQFTGLKDKNGVDVYEGDVVRFPELYETPEMTSTNYLTAKVIYIHGAFHLQQNDEKITVDRYNLAYEMNSYDGDFEVIGNIHQSESEVQS